MESGTKVTVTDETSSWHGKQGTVVAERGGMIRVQIIGFNRNGSAIDCSWHFNVDQLAVRN